MSSGGIALRGGRTERRRESEGQKRFVELPLQQFPEKGRGSLEQDAQKLKANCPKTPLLGRKDLVRHNVTLVAPLRSSTRPRGGVSVVRETANVAPRRGV
mmetsp:Transcript_11050/g.28692  ORF Transcript_11050/g.28692 Transcript_11050/m.28692 type:complete len:100 (-) Transcript_11050:1093-1392(-)